MSILFYCRGGYGSGHWIRTAALARELARHTPVTILFAGGEALSDVPGVRIISVSDGGHEQDLAEIVRQVRPGALVVEYFPFGRQDYTREIVALLEAAKRLSPRPARVYCSLRDIQQCRRRNQSEFDDRTCALVNSYFDVILVHADPALFTLEQTFARRGELTSEVRHTGYVAARTEVPRWREDVANKRILVSAGGGRGGEELVTASIEAYKNHGLAGKFSLRVLAGSQVEERFFGELQRSAAGVEGIEIWRSVPLLPEEMAAAAVSVSRCGYNTAVELLQTGCPALVVPFATPTEDEQTRRAISLARKNAWRWLAPQHADPARLAAEIQRTAVFRPERVPVRCDGAKVSAEIILGAMREAGACQF